MGSTNQDGKKKHKINIKFAKEFFITPKAEIIKMAAIVSPDDYIRADL